MYDASWVMTRFEQLLWLTIHSATSSALALVEKMQRSLCCNFHSTSLLKNSKALSLSHSLTPCPTCKILKMFTSSTQHCDEPYFFILLSYYQNSAGADHSDWDKWNYILSQKLIAPHIKMCFQTWYIMLSSGYRCWSVLLKVIFLYSYQKKMNSKKKIPQRRIIFIRLLFSLTFHCLIPIPWIISMSMTFFMLKAFLKAWLYC